jgi:hypothetical protein
MDCDRPVGRGRYLLAGALLLAASVIACVRRVPALVPPSDGVEAVEGFGSASIAGVEASLKGKFGFVFRRPGFGRVEAVDPLGRTAFLIVFRGDRAWFVVPGKKVYAEDGAAVMMGKFLGVTLLPDEAVRLLSGTWGAGEVSDGESGWTAERDAQARVVRGARGGYVFSIREFFPGDGVPREIGLEGPGTSGRVRVLKLGFNPAPREEIFNVEFLRGYAQKTWEGILELLDR